MIKTSVIGLGAMGAGIAGNLHQAGMLAGAWNRTHARGQAVASQYGFELAKDLSEAVQSADLVITSISADTDLLQISEQLVERLAAGSIVLDTSTVSSHTAQQVSELFAKAGIAFIDGPVSGGREGAEKGTMVMMAGGDSQVLEHIMPVLKVITSKVQHMGPVGSGQATKAVNQIMVAGINQAVSEALAFGAASDLDLDKVIDVISGGAAGSWFLSHRGHSMTHDSYEPGFRLALHRKDLLICQAMAAQHGVKLPTVEMTLVHYDRLLAEGHGDEDISALYRLKSAMFD